ncbi:serine aminopeptidase domain-containing protein [Nocardia sp. NPDC049526]|uniref:alpha/beta hydrolase n=1 Tax=Nocardia sp. NPDC049526 TaxID=3364316 RepID=UPI0037AE002C
MSSIAPTGIEVVEHLCSGRYAHVHGMFAAHLQALVSAEKLGTAWESVVDRYGSVVEVGAAVSEAGAVRVPVRLERGEVVVGMTIDDVDRLTGLQLRPPAAPWQPPDYADPESFDEEQVSIGQAPFVVRGTISLPRRPRSCPAVVLLAGGGPFDRDMTTGSNRPLADIAWGLASHGIAVLRFDKVTHTHAGAVAGLESFTVTDEYVPYAVAAVHALCAHPAVDADRVFVLGHSMGGKIAPRVAAAEPSVAGLIVMAGDASPMHWAAVRVTRYLATLEPDGGAAAQTAIEAIVRQAQLVDSALTGSTPASELPLGLSASYWLDLRDYDPVAAAAALGKPMFILQGGRDYQVTVDDDLSLWRTGLADRAEVTIRVYDADDHLFFPGVGPSTPADYAPAQHVDPQVIFDIVSWLAAAASIEPRQIQ